MRASNRLRNPLLAIGLALALGCSADDAKSPTAPSTPPLPPASTVNVTVSSSAASLEVNATEPATITIRAVRSDTGIPVPNLTVAALTTSLGSFGSVGGPAEVTLELVNGQATVSFFPGPTVGTASLRAQVSTGVGLTSVQIGEAGIPATFFLASVQPNTGSPQGGETVTIHGGGFSDPIRVTFDGVAANIQNATATTIRVTTPPLLEGLPAGQTRAVTVTVTINLNEEGQASDSLPSGFIYANGGSPGVLQPTIFSVTPSSGPNEGGTEVSINGDGFEAPVQVKFGTGTADASFNGAEAQILSVPRTRIIVRSPPTSCASPCAPPNPNQLASILVKNLDTGRSTVATSAFRYGNQIIITAIGPGEGPTSGGTLVTIYGQGFDEPVAVSMGAHAQAVLSVSGTEIVVRTVAIQVTGCADVSGPTQVTNIETGDSATGPAFVYRVERPIVTGVSPNSGPQGGGTAVTISGQSFDPPLTVNFRIGGQSFSASVGSITPNSISATSPGVPSSVFPTEVCDVDNDGTQGERYTSVAADIVVANPATTCSSTFAGGFRYNPSDTSCRGD